MTNESILGWLTGGVYQNFPDLLWGALETLIRFGMNVSHIFLGGIWRNFISPIVPDLGFVPSTLALVLDYAVPICVYIKDMLMISTGVFNYIIFSIIFRVSAKLGVYLLGLVVRWYNLLKP